LSQVLIQQYLNQLRDLRKVSGTHRESVVREAFKELLESWLRSHNVIFVSDDKARKAGLSPKCVLKADKDDGRIIVDSETTLTGIPPEVGITASATVRRWSGFSTSTKKKRKPNPRPSARSSNTYRFGDYKEKVIDLLTRVTTVSVRTVEFVNATKRSPT
jgi:predicted helicase